MSTLYWKNISTDNEWHSSLNWFQDSGATTPATSVPWTQNDVYKDYDLAYADGEGGVVHIGANIGVGFAITGTCALSFGSPLSNNTTEILKLIMPTGMIYNYDTQGCALRIAAGGGILFVFDTTVPLSGSRWDSGDIRFYVGTSDNPTPAQMAAKYVALVNANPWSGGVTAVDNHDGTLTITETGASAYSVSFYGPQPCMGYFEIEAAGIQYPIIDGGGIINGGTFTADGNISTNQTFSGGNYRGGQFCNFGNITGGTLCGQIQNYGNISGGNVFTEDSGGSLYNYSQITGGNFNGTQGCSIYNYGIISTGNFTGGNFSYTNYNLIRGGSFVGASYFSNSGTINGGEFSSTTGIATITAPTSTPVDFALGANGISVSCGGGVLLSFDTTKTLAQSYWTGLGHYPGAAIVGVSDWVTGIDFRKAMAAKFVALFNANFGGEYSGYLAIDNLDATFQITQIASQIDPTIHGTTNLTAVENQIGLNFSYFYSSGGVINGGTFTNPNTFYCYDSINNILFTNFQGIQMQNTGSAINGGTFNLRGTGTSYMNCDINAGIFNIEEYANMNFGSSNSYVRNGTFNHNSSQQITMNCIVLDSTWTVSGGTAGNGAVCFGNSSIILGGRYIANGIGYISPQSGAQMQAGYYEARGDGSYIQLSNSPFITGGVYVASGTGSYIQMPGGGTYNNWPYLSGGVFIASGANSYIQGNNGLVGNGVFVMSGAGSYFQGYQIGGGIYTGVAGCMQGINWQYHHGSAVAGKRNHQGW